MTDFEKLNKLAETGLRVVHANSPSPRYTHLIRKWENEDGTIAYGAIRRHLKKIKAEDVRVFEVHRGKRETESIGVEAARSALGTASPAALGGLQHPPDAS